MKILVTGAGGFIGSHLVSKLLLDKQNLVYGVMKQDNHILSNNLVKIIGDICDAEFISNFPKKIDIVIHLAQSNQYRNFPEGVNNIFSVNIYATQMLLEWCRTTGVKKFIFSSTGNVYKPQNKLLAEDDACEPVAYYGASKYASELIIKQYAQFFEIVILRLFGVYGPGQKKMTIPNIIEKIKKGEEITLAGGKGLWFTPIYIDDCVDAIAKVIEKKKVSQICNVSGNDVIHLGDLVQLIAEVLDTKPILKITEDAPMYLTGNNLKIVNEIAFVPKINIKEGIKLTLNS